MDAEEFSSLLKKYILTDEKERQRILREAEKAKKIRLEKGMFYEIDDGVLIGVSRNGKLMVYIC